MAGPAGGAAQLICPSAQAITPIAQPILPLAQAIEPVALSIPPPAQTIEPVALSICVFMQVTDVAAEEGCGPGGPKSPCIATEFRK